jgi:hypothetical protein
MNAVGPRALIALLVIFIFAIRAAGGRKAARHDTAAKRVSLRAALGISIAASDHRPASRSPISAQLLAGLQSVFSPPTLVFNSP